jgi:hypothetical protein
MREDFAKILCTTARYGSRLKNETVRRQRRKFKAGEVESLPKKQGMKPKGRSFETRKELNEYLNPLKRFLRSRIGKQWDDVYSEIREHFGKDSATHFHIFQHLQGYVKGSGGEEAQPGTAGWRYAIDSEGRLKEVGQSYRKTNMARLRIMFAEKKSEMVKISDQLFFAKDDKGLWFRLHMSPRTEIKQRPLDPMTGRPEGYAYQFQDQDVFFKITLCHPESAGVFNNTQALKRGYGRTDLYCPKKEQASKKDIRTYKLKKSTT